MLSHGLTFAALALGAAAQLERRQTSDAPTATGNAETTITALVGTLTTGFAGSVVGANGCDTTLALACTDTANPICASAESLDVTVRASSLQSFAQPLTSQQVTVTQGPTAYQFEYGTSLQGVKATISESCDLQGPSGSFTQAVCTASFSASGQGESTSSSTVSTVTDTDFFTYAQVPITAGASKLPTGSATACSASDNAAVATGISEVYKIIVPVGAALAGALL